MVVYRIFGLLCLTVNIAWSGIHWIWLICNCAIVVIQWLAIGLLILCIATRFIRLRAPHEGLVMKHLHRDERGHPYPVANQGAGLDAPENSLSAIKMCLKLKCPSILLNLSALADKLVILDRYTLEKINIREACENMTYQSLEHIDVAEHHPLGKNFAPSKILSLASLLTEVATQDVTIFLKCETLKGLHRDRLVHLIQKNEQVFSERICLVSSNPLFLYQLRKDFPDLLCGLWLNRSDEAPFKCMKWVSILHSMYSLLLRNVIVPLLGLQLVFIHKAEFNQQIADLWSGVRLIVYPVNSANEKRYFQRVTKTQYLTDSLRTEPEIIRARS